MFCTYRTIFTGLLIKKVHRILIVNSVKVSCGKREMEQHSTLGVCVIYKLAVHAQSCEPSITEFCFIHATEDISQNVTDSIIALLALLSLKQQSSDVQTIAN